MGSLRLFPAAGHAADTASDAGTHLLPTAEFSLCALPLPLPAGDLLLLAVLLCFAFWRL